LYYAAAVFHAGDSSIHSAARKTEIHIQGSWRLQHSSRRLPRAGDSVRPAILWIHGGALIMGNRGGLRFEQLEKYLDAGYTDYQPLRPVSARSGRK
jgi:acetyl esterase/lipase